jgi:hypothetical protein
MDAIVDNDIVFKLVCYGLIGEMLLGHREPHRSVGVLGAARYVIKKRITKKLQTSAATAIERLEAFIDKVIVLEPTEAEQLMAANFELAAQRAAVALDTGESQLCAILIVRALPLLLTGDKRAICAIEQLLTVDERLKPVSGKVKCLEQLMLDSLSEDNCSRYRSMICHEAGIDRTLAICFSCSGDEAAIDGIITGLKSYINDLRSQAQHILAA